MSILLLEYLERWKWLSRAVHLAYAAKSAWYVSTTHITRGKAFKPGMPESCRKLSWVPSQ